MRLQNQEERTRPQTSASVDAQIKHFQDRHAKDLKRAHEYEAALYWQNAVDLWQSTQELPANHASRAYDAAVQVGAAIVLSGTYSSTSLSQVVERFGSENRDAWRSSPSAPLYLLETRHAHHRMLLPLSAKRKDLLKKEEQGQRRLESMFPQSVEEWRMMKHDDLQRRVARYLASDGKRQEVLRDEYKWAWRQTDSLIREYGSNVSFLRPTCSRRVSDA